jgi:methylated-DNA-[protein]-cysteine S-methyltransferase
MGQNGVMPERSHAAIRTPVGQLSVACTGLGVASIRFGARPQPAPARPGDAALPDPAQPGPAQPGPAQPGPAQPEAVLPGDALPGDALPGDILPGGVAQPAAPASLAAAAAAQLAEYFAGQRRVFELPFDRRGLSPLQDQVLGTLFDSVPFGQTITYGELARLAGVEETSGDLPARVIGQVMGSNPCPVIVPCHRVVAADGIGGYSGGTGIEIKRWLLIFEGSLPPTLDWTPQGPTL